MRGGDDVDGVGEATAQPDPCGADGAGHRIERLEDVGDVGPAEQRLRVLGQVGAVVVELVDRADLGESMHAHGARKRVVAEQREHGCRG